MERAQIALCDLLNGGNFTKFRKLYRLAGQSGSGKTTRLLPGMLRNCNGTPVIISVGFFAQYHPTLPATERERTNGFALKCLYVALKSVIEHGYMIVVDKTLLAPELESHVWNWLQSNDYQVEYHIKAVSKQQSDEFIKTREQQTGRKVSEESSEYFYEILPIALEFLATKDYDSTATVWTAFGEEPIHVGDLTGAVDALHVGRASD